MLFRTHISKVAATQGRAILEGVGVPPSILNETKCSLSVNLHSNLGRRNGNIYTKFEANLWGNEGLIKTCLI